MTFHVVQKNFTVGTAQRLHQYYVECFGCESNRRLHQRSGGGSWREAPGNRQATECPGGFLFPQHCEGNETAAAQ